MALGQGTGRPEQGLRVSGAGRRRVGSAWAGWPRGQAAGVRPGRACRAAQEMR